MIGSPDPQVMTAMNENSDLNSNPFKRFLAGLFAPSAGSTRPSGPPPGYFQSALAAAQNNPSPDISGGMGSYVNIGGHTYDAETAARIRAGG